MKTVLVILVLVAIYLFYPFYDLYVKPNAFAESYYLSAKGYTTHGKCVEAARAQAEEYYQCRKRTVWRRMFSSYTQYNPEIREQQHALEGEESSGELFEDLQ